MLRWRGGAHLRGCGGNAAARAAWPGPAAVQVDAAKPKPYVSARGKKGKREEEGKREEKRTVEGNPDKSNRAVVVSRAVGRQRTASRGILDVVDVGIACRANVVPVCTYPVVKASLYLPVPRRAGLLLPSLLPAVVSLT